MPHELHDNFRRFTVLAVASLLLGCIQVDDFGSYWDRGFVDACINAIIMAEMAEDIADGKPVPAIRSLSLNGHTFVMVRDKPGDKGGELVRYDIIGNEYVPYRLNEDKRQDFLHYYPDSSVVLTSETATIPLLDDKSAGLLSSIAGDPGYWVETGRRPYNPDNRSDCKGSNK